jgi:hypothetical protein
MFTYFFEICQKVNFKLNLFELLIGLTILVLIKVVIVLVKRIIFRIRNDSIIDERLRERRSRIARVAAEINYTAIPESGPETDSKSNLESNLELNVGLNIEENGAETIQASLEPSIIIDDTSETKTLLKTEQIVDIPQQVINEKLTSGNQEITTEGSKKKKTRAMSMEERWADFDRKRAARNSA